MGFPRAPLGHSMAQVFAMGGCSVRCYDPVPAARESLLERIQINLRAMVDAGLLDSSAATEALSRVSVFVHLADALEGATLVSEASNTHIKQALAELLSKGGGQGRPRQLAGAAEPAHHRA